MVIWLIGLSGAGKTTIGREVHALLRRNGSKVVLLDGDAFREVMGDDLGHGLDDRRRNAGRICRLCKLLDEQQIDVVCCILSIFEESREWNRQNLNDYTEVFIDVPMDELIRRDPKGLYRKALAGEVRDVAGIDLEFEQPKSPDLVIENHGPDADITKFSEQIVRTARAKSKY
jgi:cytidine diphosphoramidate kinase